MFTEEVTMPDVVSVAAAPSLACDLSWLLSVAARPSMQARYPQLAEMFNGREHLTARLRSFWADGADEMCFTEMQVLAHHGGATRRTEPEALWRGVEAAVRTIPMDLELPSETPEERAAVFERIRQLKESPALLRSYLDLLREVWEPVDGMWQQSLPLIEEAGRHVVAQFERGRSLESFITPGCDILRDRLPLIAANVRRGLPLLFVPCLFFGTSMYLEFADLVVIGTGVGQGDVLARARTESVARRLKAVADPTRLALLHALAGAPGTIGELASHFGLAQPTVSMHVKVLRQGGLVRAERRDGKLELRADPSAVESLLEDFRRAALHGGPASAQDASGASTTGSDRMPATVVDNTGSAGPVTA